MSDRFTKIGQELKSCREAKGIELAFLADRTNINISFLMDIENGRFNFLPKPYVRAFLRTFAQEVGLDANVVAAQFEAALSDKKPGTAQKVGEEFELMPNLHSKKPQATKENSIEKAVAQTQWNFPRFLETKTLITIGGFIILLVVVLITVIRPEKESNQQTDVLVQEIPLEAGLQVEDSALVIVEPETELQFQEMPLRLTITASETTWMRIGIDDLITDECIFTPGDVRTWESRKKFALELGNAGGVNLSLNGRPLGVPGVSGRVARVIVTEEGIQRIYPRSAANESGSTRIRRRE